MRRSSSTERSSRTCADPGAAEVTAERTERLEFKVAHLEKALQELSDVLYRQQRELDTLRDRSRQLDEQVRQLEARGGDDADRDEIPPHY